MNNDQIIELMNSCESRPDKLRKTFFDNHEHVTKNIMLSFTAYLHLFDVYGLDLIDLLPNKELEYFTDAINDIYYDLFINLVTKEIESKNANE